MARPFLGFGIAPAKPKAPTPLTIAAITIATLLLLRFASAAIGAIIRRPEVPIRSSLPSSEEADRKFFGADPAKIERMKKNSIPWDGKGLDPNFPIK